MLCGAGGQVGAGGPHRKWFSAGRVEARRSRVGRARAPLVCTEHRPRRLHLHPRDRFDNPAALQHPAARGFTVHLSPLGDPSGEADPELDAAAAIEYDSVERRVSVALCFPRAGVFRAAVHYEGALLHNGEFDCIVLTGADAVTVSIFPNGRDLETSIISLPQRPTRKPFSASWVLGAAPRGRLARWVRAPRPHDLAVSCACSALSSCCSRTTFSDSFLNASLRFGSVHRQRYGTEVASVTTVSLPLLTYLLFVV